MSDPSQALNSFMSRVVKKSRSETENVDAIGSATEVEAGTLENGEDLWSGNRTAWCSQMWLSLQKSNILLNIDIIIH